MSMLGGIVSGLLLLSIMMFLHELGHFIVGRKLGFTVIEFSIFMGPRIFSWSKNGIRYSLKLIPIGASVQFAGEYNGDPQGKEKAEADLGDAGWQKGDFYERPRLYRALVAVAGPAVNLLSGVLAFIILFLYTGAVTNVIADIQKDSLAERAGLMAGDKILKINNHTINNNLDMSVAVNFAGEGELPVEFIRNNEIKQAYLTQKKVKRNVLGINLRLTDDGFTVTDINKSIRHDGDSLRVGDKVLSINGGDADPAGVSEFWSANPDLALPLKVERDGKIISLNIKPVQIEQLPAMGIELSRDFSFAGVIGRSFTYSVSIVKVTFISLGKLLTGAISAKENLSGPIGVVSVISNVVTDEIPLAVKLLNLLSIFGLVSLSLGIMNLLPIPPLDGNLLLMTAVEAVRGKPLSMRAQTVLTIVGLLIVASLFILGFYFDIARLLGA